MPLGDQDFHVLHQGFYRIPHPYQSVIMEALINEMMVNFGGNVEQVITYVSEYYGYAEELVRTIIVEDLDL